MTRSVSKPGRSGISPLEVLCGLTAIAIPLVLASFIFRYTVNVPHWDEFEWAPLILHLHAGTLTFSELWVQHNDHRMFFGRLIALGLDRLGGWSQLRECLASLAVVVVGQLFLLGLLRATFSRRVASVVLVIDTFLLFALSQEGNWIWGFQTVWFLINTCVLAAVWLLSESPVGLQRLLLAAAFAYVSSFSSLFGLNVWPAGLIVLALGVPLRWSLLAVWSALGVVAFALYFYHYQFLGHSPAGAEHVSLAASAIYFLAYLGGPFGGWAGSPVSATLGATGLAGYVAAAILLLRNPPAALRPRAAPWIGLGSFAILSAAVTTLGRAGLGAHQALESRYITPSTMLWISLVSLCVLVVSAFKPPLAVRAALGVCLLGGAVLYGFASMRGVSDFRADYADRLSDYYLARRVSLDTDEQLSHLYPSPSEVRADLEGLRDIGQGPSATERP